MLPSLTGGKAVRPIRGRADEPRPGLGDAANMYFVPVALLIERDDEWLGTTAGVPDVDGLGWGSFLLDNLLPVTIGNVIGGGVLVGAVYWLVYLRRKGSPAGSSARS